MTLQKLKRLVALFVVFVLLSGCSGGSDAPATVPVKGTVTYKGKPIESLAVSFMPENGQIATGTTDAAGKFELMTNKPGDGAAPGNYKVGISFVTSEIPPMPGMEGSQKYKAPVSPIPAKYADITTSGLTKTVDKDPAKNDFTFDLTD